MAGPAPKTEKWTARENLHQPEGLHLLVGGTVEVSASNLAPLLAGAEDDGDVLVLDLTLVEGLDPVVENRGEDPTDYFVIGLDGRPIGEIQSYRIDDGPDYAAMVAEADLIVDTRNAIKTPAPNVFKLGAPHPEPEKAETVV